MPLNFDTHGETVQIWGPAAGTDSLGNPTNAWSVNKGTVKGIVSNPGTLTPLDASTPVGRIHIADKIIIVQSDAAIATGYRLEIDSINYDCMGEYADWIVRRHGAINHMQIDLKKVVE